MLELLNRLLNGGLAAELEIVLPELPGQPQFRRVLLPAEFELLDRELQPLLRGLVRARHARGIAAVFLGRFRRLLLSLLH